MAAAATARIQTSGLEDSIFSLLDDSWYSQSILNLSKVHVPLTDASGIHSQTEQSMTRFLEAVRPIGTASSLEECSSSPAPDVLVNGKTGSDRLYVIDESEMRRVFDRFDKNADGSISGDELRQYMKCWRFDMSDADAISMISSVDRNSDGAVDFEEFLSLYTAFYPGSMAEVGEEGILRAYEDDDDDDLLEAFRVFDKNQDGFISAQELQAVLLDLGISEGKSLMRCQNMIHNVDRDGNGQCDILEFQKMMSAPIF